MIATITQISSAYKEQPKCAGLLYSDVCFIDPFKRIAGPKSYLVQNYLVWKLLFFSLYFKIRDMSTICLKWTYLVWWEWMFFNCNLINCIYAFRRGNYWCLRWNLRINKTWSILLCLLFLIIHHFFQLQQLKLTGMNPHLARS